MNGNRKHAQPALPSAAFLRKSKLSGNDRADMLARLRRAARFYERFPEPPDLAGREVMDFGTGLGALAIHAAQQGAATVHAIDLDQQSLRVAGKLLAEIFPALAETIVFECLSVDAITDKSYDLVVSMAVMEHVADPVPVLQAISRLLRPGGKVYLGIGPLYCAPWGDHNRLEAPLRNVFPWSHLLFSERWLLTRYARKHPDLSVSHLMDLGLNGLRLGDYVRAIEDSGLTTRYFVVNRHENRLASEMLNLFRRIPLLHDLLTVNIYCVLEK